MPRSRPSLVYIIMEIPRFRPTFTDKNAEFDPGHPIKIFFFPTSIDHNNSPNVERKILNRFSDSSHRNESYMIFYNLFREIFIFQVVRWPDADWLLKFFTSRKSRKIMFVTMGHDWLLGSTNPTDILASRVVYPVDSNFLPP